MVVSFNLKGKRKKEKVHIFEYTPYFFGGGVVRKSIFFCNSLFFFLRVVEKNDKKKTRIYPGPFSFFLFPFSFYLVV